MRIFVFRHLACLSVLHFQVISVEISCNEFPTQLRFDDYRGNCTFSFINIDEDDDVSVSYQTIYGIMVGKIKMHQLQYIIQRLLTRASTQCPIKSLKNFKIWNLWLQMKSKSKKLTNYASKMPTI